MHPAPSVILFTSLSGLGFGLLAWLGLGIPDVFGRTAFAFYFVAYGLAVGGLLFSVGHLGNKKNAIKAFSQWRTSWLSREGIMAIVTLLTIAPYAIGRIFFDTSIGWLGILGAIFCAVTVFTTSMIYAQLKTVPRWKSPFTPVLFLLYMVTGGAILSSSTEIAGILCIVLGIAQLLAWSHGDGQFARSGASLETATGLGRIGRVRQLEPPHSASNYLLKEMAYEVGRKHAKKLRIIAIATLSVIPAVILLYTNAGHGMAVVAVLTHLVGLLTARWLFFAEARHVVSLYYDR